MVTKEDVVRLTRRQVLTCAQYYIHTTENQQDLLYSTGNSIQYFVITVKKIESDVCCIICKYFLPFAMLSSFFYGFLHSAKSCKFDYVPFIYFCISIALGN